MPDQDSLSAAVPPMRNRGDPTRRPLSPGAVRPFGQLLRELRMQAGLTQSRLAEAAEISVRAVRALEHDPNRHPRLETARLLAGALDLDGPARSRFLASARGDVNAAGLSEARAHWPQFLTPILGRESEIGILQLLLEERRLVTLTGAGGVGKTRLAVAVASQVLSSFDRAVFVDLAPVSSAASVPGEVARALSIWEDPARSTLDQVADDIGTRRILLLLDNLEHLLTATDSILFLLQACPNLTVIVTSRVVLAVRGEGVYTVAPLQLPQDDADIEYSPAVRLFVERAGDAGVSLNMDPVTAAAVADVCRLLDGLPLAIELTAAWTRTLSPESILSRLRSGNLSPDRGSRDLPRRQQTMQATIAWSFDLGSPEEQRVFEALSVFSGGCTLASAETVCRGSGGHKPPVLEVLSSLVEQSLVMVQELAPRRNGSSVDGELRYGMLETVKTFAKERLVSTSSYEELHERHAYHFLDLAETSQPQLSGPGRAMLLDRLDRERDNLRAALEFARDRDDTALGLNLTTSLAAFWLARSYFDEANVWFNEFLKREESGLVQARARALVGHGTLISAQGDNDTCLTMCREAVALARQAGDDSCTAAALFLQAGALLGLGEYDAIDGPLRESLDIYRKLEDRNGVCGVLNVQAAVRRFRGDFVQSATLYEEALLKYRAAEDARGCAYVLARLGNMATERGDPLASYPFYDEAMSLNRSLHDEPGRADVLERRGETETSLGNYAAALEFYDESLEIFRATGTKYGVAFALVNKSEALIGLSRLDQAEAVVRRSLRLFNEIGDPRSVGFAFMHLGDVERSRQHLDESLAFYRQSLEMHQRLRTRPQIARCLERIMLVCCSKGKTRTAVLLHGAALTLRGAMGSSMTPAETPPYERALATMRADLGGDAYAALEADGRALSLESAIQTALDM